MKKISKNKTILRIKESIFAFSHFSHFKSIRSLLALNLFYNKEQRV